MALVEKHRWGATLQETWSQPVSLLQPFRPQCAFICVDRIDAKNPWLIGPHVHDDAFELLHVMEGTYDCRVNQTTLQLAPGQTLIVRPADVHEDIAHLPCTFLAVRFLLLGSHRYARRFEIFAKSARPQDLVLSDTGSLLIPYHERVSRELQALTPFSACFLDALTLTLFLELVGRLPGQVLSSDIGQSTQHTLEARLIQIFQEHREETLSVGTIAKRLGMSVSSLERACKRELNMSVARAIMSFRMQEALQWIRYTRTPIRDVSQLVGFSNQNHFSAAFKKHFGCAPTSFRGPQAG